MVGESLVRDDILMQIIYLLEVIRLVIGTPLVGVPTATSTWRWRR
jgi:hypothetical protein